MHKAKPRLVWKRSSDELARVSSFPAGKNCRNGIPTNYISILYNKSEVRLVSHKLAVKLGYPTFLGVAFGVY